MNLRTLAAFAVAGMVILSGCGSDATSHTSPMPSDAMDKIIAMYTGQGTSSHIPTDGTTMDKIIAMNTGPLAPPPPPPPDCNVLKCIALTFDDGPGGGTGQVLDNLRDRGAKATFFVLGSLAEANPDVIRRMVAEGHQLANHSWGHRNLASIGPAAAAADIQRTNETLFRIAGVRPTVMRPPYGATNDAVIASVGMPQMIWTVDPQDWKNKSSSYVASHVVNNTTRGDIILLHDIHWSTVSAVPAILDGLLAQGYTFVTIDELYGHRPLEVRKHYSQYR